MSRAPAGSPRTRDGRGSVTRSVLRGAGVILVVTVFARLLGFVRYLVFGASIGAGDVGTAYTTANMLPTVLFEIAAGGVLAAVVVPLIAGLVPEGDPTDRLGPDAERPVADADRPVAAGGDGAGASTAAAQRAGEDPVVRGPAADGAALADRIVSTLLTWTLLGTTVLAVLVAVLAAPLARLLLSAEAPADGDVALGATLLRMFAPQLPLYGISVVLAAYLQARKRFFWPAMMPLLSSVVVMVSYRVYAVLVPAVATTTTIGPAAVWWLGAGTTAGVAAMALPVAVVSLRSGLRLRPSLSMPPGVGRRALALGGAGLGAVGAQQLVLALVMVLAMRAGGVGTLPVFQYGQALYLLPYAVLVVPLVTSVFPHLAELRLVGDRVGFAEVSAASVRTVMAVSVVGAAMLVAAGPALEQFFRLIDRAGATGVGATTAGLALGLVGFAVTTQCSRILAAALRARDALLVGSLGWLVAGGAILVMVLPSPQRSAAEAATVFALAIALGMALAGLMGLARIADLLERGGHLARVRRTALAVPVAVLAGGVPGLLLGKQLVTADAGEARTVLIGILCGLVAALLSAVVMAAADPETSRTLVRRLRAGRHGSVEPRP